MPEEKDEPTGFKVVDRRSFAADGTRVGDAPEAEEKPEVPTAQSAGREPQPEPQPGPKPAPEEPVEEEEEGFVALLSELYATALMQMGLVSGPNGEGLPPDLVGAHRTIDLLEVLQQKTRGNLTAKESRLFEQILYELRMGFLEINQRLAQKQK